MLLSCALHCSRKQSCWQGFLSVLVSFFKKTDLTIVIIIIYDFSIHEEHEENSNETDTNSTKKEPKVNITGSWLSSFLLPGKDFESEDALFVERSDFTYDEDGYHTEYNISEFPHDLDTRLGAKVLKVVTG